jgi:hypothetical protein
MGQKTQKGQVKNEFAWQNRFLGAKVCPRFETSDPGAKFVYRMSRLFT